MGGSGGEIGWVGMGCSWGGGVGWVGKGCSVGGGGEGG